MNIWHLPPPPGTSPLHQPLMMQHQQPMYQQQQQQQQQQNQQQQQQQHHQHQQNLKNAEAGHNAMLQNMGMRCGSPAMYHRLEDPSAFWPEFSRVRPPPPIGTPQQFLTSPPPPPPMINSRPSQLNLNMAVLVPPPCYTTDRYAHAPPPYVPCPTMPDFRDQQMLDDGRCNSGHMWQSYTQPPQPRMTFDPQQQPYVQTLQLANYMQHQQRPQPSLYPYPHNPNVNQQYQQLPSQPPPPPPPPPPLSTSSWCHQQQRNGHPLPPPLVGGSYYPQPPPPPPPSAHLATSSVHMPYPMPDYREMSARCYECPSRPSTPQLCHGGREFNVTLPPPPLPLLMMPPTPTKSMQNRQQQYYNAGHSGTYMAPPPPPPAKKTGGQCQKFPERTYSRRKLTQNAKQDHRVDGGTNSWRLNGRSYSEVVEKPKRNRGNRNESNAACRSFKEDFETRFREMSSSSSKDTGRRRFDNDTSSRFGRETDFHNRPGKEIGACRYDSDMSNVNIKILPRPNKVTDLYAKSTGTLLVADDRLLSTRKEVCPANNYQIRLVNDGNTLPRPPCRSKSDLQTIQSRHLVESSCKKNLSSLLIDEVANCPMVMSEPNLQAVNTFDDLQKKLKPLGDFETNSYTSLREPRKKVYRNQWNFTDKATCRKVNDSRQKLVDKESIPQVLGTSELLSVETIKSPVPTVDNRDIESLGSYLPTNDKQNNDSTATPESDEKEDGRNSLSSNADSNSYYDPKSTTVTTSSEELSQISDVNCPDIEPVPEVVAEPSPVEDTKEPVKRRLSSDDGYAYTIDFECMVDQLCSTSIGDSAQSNAITDLDSPTIRNPRETQDDETMACFRAISANLLNHPCNTTNVTYQDIIARRQDPRNTGCRQPDSGGGTPTNMCTAFAKLCDSLATIKLCLDDRTNKTQVLLENTEQAFRQFQDSYLKSKDKEELMFDNFKYPTDISYEDLRSLSAAESMIALSGSSPKAAATQPVGSYDSGIAEYSHASERRRLHLLACQEQSQRLQSYADMHRERIRRWSQDRSEARQRYTNQCSFVSYEDVAKENQSGRDVSFNSSTNIPCSSEKGSFLQGYEMPFNNNSCESEETGSPQNVMTLSNMNLSLFEHFDSDHKLDKSYDENFPDFLRHKKLSGKADSRQNESPFSTTWKKTGAKFGAKKANFRNRNCCKRRINYATLMPSKDGDSDKDEIKDYLKPGCYAVPPTSTLSLPTFGIPVSRSKRKSSSAPSSAKSRNNFYRLVMCSATPAPEARPLPPRRDTATYKQANLNRNQPSDKASYLYTGTKPKSLLELIKNSRSSDKAEPFSIKQLEVGTFAQDVDSGAAPQEKMFGRTGDGLKLRKKSVHKKATYIDWLKQTLNCVSSLQEDVYTSDASSRLPTEPPATLTKSASEEHAGTAANGNHNNYSAEPVHQRASSASSDFAAAVATAASTTAAADACARNRRVFVGNPNRSRSRRAHHRRSRRTPTKTEGPVPTSKEDNFPSRLAKSHVTGKGQKWQQIAPGLFHTLEKKRLAGEGSAAVGTDPMCTDVAFNKFYSDYTLEMDPQDTCGRQWCGLRGCRRLIIMLTKVYQEMWEMEESELLKDAILDEESGQMVSMENISCKLTKLEYTTVEEFVFDFRQLIYVAHLNYRLDKVFTDKLRALEIGFSDLLDAYFEGWDFRHICLE